MAKADEIGKAKARGQTLTPAELALEDARDAWHRSRKNPERARAMREASKVVQAERRAAREAREAAGPPAEAVQVTKDANGRVMGWVMPTGDVVVSPGGGGA